MVAVKTEYVNTEIKMEMPQPVLQYAQVCHKVLQGSMYVDANSVPTVVGGKSKQSRVSMLHTGLRGRNYRACVF